MSDRIAVMNGGRFEQMGTPEEIYEHPATRFAAEFIGQSNMLDCTVAETSSSGLVLDCGGERLPARAADFDAKAGDKVCLCLRTERLSFSAERSGCGLSGILTQRRYAGGAMRATIRLRSGQEMLVLCGSADRARGEIGGEVFLSWNPEEAPVVRA